MNIEKFKQKLIKKVEQGRMSAEEAFDRLDDAMSRQSVKDFWKELNLGAK